MHLLAYLHLLVQVGHRLHVLALHVRDDGRLLVDQHSVMRRVRGELGVLLQESFGVRLDLLLQVAPEPLRLLRVLVAELCRDRRSPSQPVAHPCRAKISGPYDTNLAPRCQPGRNAFVLSRVIARVLAKRLKLLLNLLLGNQLDAQRELE